MRRLGALQTAAAAAVLPWFCMCGTEADFLPAAGLTSSAHTYAALGQSCTRGDEEEVAHWQGALAAPAVPERRALQKADDVDSDEGPVSAALLDSATQQFGADMVDELRAQLAANRASGADQLWFHAVDTQTGPIFNRN